MKRILLITLDYYPDVGGVANYIHQFAGALSAKDIIVYAPIAEGTKAWDDKQPYTIVRKKQLSPKFIWPRWFPLFFTARKLIKEYQTNLVLVHHVLPVGYVARMLKRALKVPYLVFSHGTDVLLGTKNTWKRRMMRVAVEKSEQMIFNSESLKKRFLRVFPQFENKSQVLYPCPDAMFFSKPEDQMLNDLRAQYALVGKRVMLSVSRLVDGKGFPHLVRVLSRVVKEVPDLVWCIIGSGEKQAYILELIREHHLQNVVRFIGEVPHEQLVPYYYLADLFTLLTHPDEGQEEGLGLVFLEAAAAGIPVVAGKSGGVEEAVLHTQTGLMVDVRQDGDAVIADTIVKILKDPTYAKKLGEQAKERMSAQFRWEHQLGVISSWID